MSIFDRLDRMVSRTVDRQFSVGAVISPVMRTPNGRAVPDPHRGEIIVRGVLVQTPSTAQIEEGNRNGSGNDFRSLVHGALYELSIDTARYPDAAQIRQGDRLALDDARVFQVSSVQPDGLSRSVLILSKWQGAS